MKSPFIYLRGLKHADHTVFCVEEGQKNYYNQQFSARVPYSSGQQIKRSILSAVSSCLNESVAPITFNYEISKKGELGMGEPWSPCDPSFTDQLLGGWMKAATGEITLKKRSPLSISAMRPIHPLLATLPKENITFDRSDNPEHHPVRVRNTDGKLLTDDEVLEFLRSNNRTLGRRSWIPDQTRAEGLFIYDIAIDLRTLFTVSINQHEPEISESILNKLMNNGWKETQNIFGKCIVCPKDRRDNIIDALANSLVNWRLTTNQARTFSLMETLAIAISDNANKVAGAIRAKLCTDTEKQKAVPVIDDTAGADLFIALPCDGYIAGVYGTPNALCDAEDKLKQMMHSFDFENQL
ncbi:MAG: CRISPR-associated protein Cas7 [Bacillota bacterium]